MLSKCADRHMCHPVQQSYTRWIMVNEISQLQRPLWGQTRVKLPHSSRAAPVQVLLNAARCVHDARRVS